MIGLVSKLASFTVDEVEAVEALIDSAGLLATRRLREILDLEVEDRIRRLLEAITLTYAYVGELIDQFDGENMDLNAAAALTLLEQMAMGLEYLIVRLAAGEATPEVAGELFEELARELTYKEGDEA